MHALIDPIVHYILEAAVATISTAATAIVVQLAHALHIKLTELQETRIRAIVQQAAQYAEESVEAEAKKCTLQGSVAFVDKGAAKMRTALAYLKGRLPKLSQPQAETMLTAELVHVGVGATVQAEKTDKSHGQTSVVGFTLPTMMGGD